MIRRDPRAGLPRAVRPRVGLRFIPKSLFHGNLAGAERPYVCVGDYEELRGLPIAEIADRLYGGLRHRDPERFGGFANHHWRLAWHYEPSEPGRLASAAVEATEFYVVKIDLDDDLEVDLFPGTWKAIAYIATDAVRMEGHPEVRRHLLAIHGGKNPFDGASKEAVDFYEYGDPGNNEYSDNVQATYYSYLSSDSSYTDTIMSLFGVSNRCWHGRGYVGAYGEIYCRVFLTRNLLLSSPLVRSCQLMRRDEILP